MLEPSEIKKLDQSVVNRIAAGEIILRPANALKELIENSLDARATYIQVTVKSGGLKLIQIQDNGTGIRREDLEIVCERFTTSKLNTFEDLTHIATFGFRGEALASISHVAHLTVQTKTSKEVCGYKACYENGKLKAPTRPCAGNQGTIITIEDLFYSMPQRKQALKSPAEEFQRITDVLTKYAIHNSHVSFSLKKYGEQPSIKTAANSQRLENIRLIYGYQIARELMDFSLRDEVHQFEANGMITKVNYAAKKGIMLLFINQRLVESAALKAAIDTVYATYLPRGMHPFVYINLTMKPENIDVNVHPTKHEVHFMYEDEIIDKIKACIEAELLGSNSTRTFYKQLKLPGVKQESQAEQTLNSDVKTAAKNMIRTDAKEQKLEKFFNESAMLKKSDSGHSTASIVSDDADESFRTTAARKSKQVRLTSVLDMQRRVEVGCDVNLRSTVKEMVFVGVVNSIYTLFQYETKLFMANTAAFCEELFYQRLVYEFQNYAQIRIEPKLGIKELLLIALNSQESGWTEEDGDKVELANNATAILLEKSPIMREYFALCINDVGELESLPALVTKHSPSSTFLPLYLLRLATEVEWEEEERCFETFCRETATYYARIAVTEYAAERKRYKWIIEHVLYPAMRKYLLPPTKLKQHLYELANLPQLYKVFERC